MYLSNYKISSHHLKKINKIKKEIPGAKNLLRTIDIP